MARLLLFVGFMSVGLWVSSLIFVKNAPKSPPPPKQVIPPQRFEQFEIKRQYGNAALWHIKAKRGEIDDIQMLLHQVIFNAFETNTEGSKGANPAPNTLRLKGESAQFFLQSKSKQWLLKQTEVKKYDGSTLLWHIKAKRGEINDTRVLLHQVIFSAFETNTEGSKGANPAPNTLRLKGESAQFFLQSKSKQWLLKQTEVKKYDGSTLLWHIKAKRGEINDTRVLLHQVVFSAFETNTEGSKGANPAPNTLRLKGESAQFFLQSKSKQWLLKGSVHLVDSLGRSIEAARITYLPNQSLLLGEGNVVITEENVVQKASHISYNLNLGEMVLKNAAIHITPQPVVPK